jgi:hypothetical protein
MILREVKSGNLVSSEVSGEQENRNHSLMSKEGKSESRDIFVSVFAWTHYSERGKS